MVLNMETGIIFDIKEFAVFDGPGMRQTVFLKGCPLRCRWCHNPEGLLAAPQLMIRTSSCIRCGKCRDICKTGQCTVCGKCVMVCPLHLRSITGKEMTVSELVQVLEKNSGYYSRYGGGVTFSGGEPLMQHDFLRSVLKRIPDMHRAVETSGYASEDIFEEVLEHLDYVIMDFKIFDGELHRRYTGAGNTPILLNIKKLCSGNIPFVIRIPVIPGVNDNEKNYRDTARFIAGAKALEKVELLPYHKTAGAKYGMAGMEYRPGFDTNRSVWISEKIFAEYGIRSEVL